MKLEKMKNSLIFKGSITIFLLSLTTSCYSGKSIYTNATMGSTAGYVAKPEYNGENESALYVSGEFGKGNAGNNGSLGGNDETGTKAFGTLNVHRAHAHKKFNFYYGLGGQFGTFKFSQKNFRLEESGMFISAGKKNFYALQFITGINYLVSRPYADFRILGLDFGYISEFGPYFDTLQQLESKNLESVLAYDEVEVFQKPSIFYLGLSSEILFKVNEKNSIGINPFAARSFLESKSGLNPNIYGVTFNYRYSDVTMSFFNELNSQYGVNTYTCKFGLAYRLN